MKIKRDNEVDAIYFKLSNVPMGKIRGRLKTENYEEDGVLLNVDTAETKSGEHILYGIEILGIEKIINESST